MTYPPSIEAYREACDEILGWMPDWLSQHEFDMLSRAHNPRGRRAVHFTGETVLPPLWGDPNLQLVQIMQRHGLIEVEDRDGVIFYRKAQS